MKKSHFLIIFVSLFVSLPFFAGEYQDYIDAAKRGEAKAQFQLAECFYAGKGIEKDTQQAIYWWRKAAVQGYPQAQAILGGGYKAGFCMEKDLNQAAFWLTKAAEQGEYHAQYWLGLSYIEGDCVKKNPKLAFDWFQKSADQGYAKAQFALAERYIAGEGVAKNTEKGIFWLRKAAEKGDVEAQYFLGLFYKRGYGVEKDLNQAIFWLKKAVEKDYSDAKKQYENAISEQIRQNRSWFANEGLAWARLLTSPLDIFSPMLTTYYHIYADEEWSFWESVFVSPFIPIVSLPPGIVMFLGDVFTSFGEMVCGSTLDESHFPWECFDYEIIRNWNSFFWLIALSGGGGGSSDLNTSGYGTTSNPYGPYINQYGQPVQYQPAFGGVSGEQLQIKKDVYAPGVHEDQYGRPVYERPAF